MTTHPLPTRSSSRVRQPTLRRGGLAALLAAVAFAGCSDGSGGDARADDPNLTGGAAFATGGAGGGATGGEVSLATGGGSPTTGGASAGGGLTGGAAGGAPAGGGPAVPPPPICGEASNAYGGAARALPGTLEAEDYDPLGYFDASDGNEGAAYRTDEDVDVKVLGDGHAIGWMTAGEWLEYTVEVATAGDYRVTLRLGAVEPGRTLSLASCGEVIADEIAVPLVADWGEVTEATVDVRLEAGLQILRVTVGASDYLDLDALEFELLPDGGGTGGAGSGGGGTGGAGTGGDTTGGAGTGGTTCPLPSSFEWISTGPLAEPKSPAGRNFVSLKDFTVVHWESQYVVYATVFDTTASWHGVEFEFDDWEDMAAAPQTYLGSAATGGTVAPTLFYFEPDDVWVLTYQWGFKYATGTDPKDPSTWTSPTTLLTGDPTNGTGTGPIDQTVICDSTDCFLFFAGDNGHIYRASMPIGEFPGTFSNAVSIMSDTTANLFEAVQVYTVKGTGQYLMIVEAMGGGGRYFRAFTASSLGGTFTAMPGASTEATPFAGKNNVTFDGAAWTDDISHGDLVRYDPSQTQTVDACRLELLYQGRDPDLSTGYNQLPYRPGLLTAAE